MYMLWVAIRYFLIAVWICIKSHRNTLNLTLNPQVPFLGIYPSIIKKQGNYKVIIAAVTEQL